MDNGGFEFFLVLISTKNEQKAMLLTLVCVEIWKFDVEIGLEGSRILCVLLM